MNKGFSLLDIVYANRTGDEISGKLKSLVYQYGSLGRNVSLHHSLLVKIPRYHKSSPQSLKILKRKINEVESRIDQYILLYLEADISVPQIALEFVRLIDLKTKIGDKPTTNINDEKITQLESENQSLNNTIAVQNKKIKTLVRKSKFKLGNLTNEEFETVADSTRKKNGTINYTKMGEHLGVSRDTVRKELETRGLTYLKTPPS